MKNIQKIIFKGIVVDVLDDNKVIVLMSDGDIKKVTPHRPYEIGEEILFTEKVVTKKVTNWNRILSFTSAVAIASLLFFMNIPLISDSNNSIGVGDAYAQVWIESKSNVKVNVDKNHEVIGVTPLDRSAKKVLDALDWNGEQVDEFIGDYFEEMKNKGYLGAEDKAVISVVPMIESENNDETLKIIKEAVNKNEIIKVNHIKVFTVALPKKVVEKAECLGLTPAKFSIMLIAKSVGKNIPPIDVLKTVTVTELIDLNPTVANILPNYSEEKLVKLAEQHNNTNTALAPSEGENSQATTPTTTPSDQPTPDQPTPNETTEQNNQPASNKTPESDNTTTQNETYSYSGDSQDSGGTESVSDSTESYNSTESTDSTEKTQTTSDDTVSKDNLQDNSTSSTNTESEQSPSVDNEQSSDQQPKQEKTGEEKQNKDEQGNQDINKQEDKQDENKQSENPQDQENQNKDEQDKQDAEKQNNDKQNENQRNNDEQDKPANEEPDKKPSVLDQLMAVV